MDLHQWREWLATAPLPEKLAALTGIRPEVTLTAAEQYAEYVKARRAFEQGTGSWDDVEAWINDDVSRLITLAEDQERERQRAEQARALAIAEAQADARRQLASIRRRQFALAPFKALTGLNVSWPAVVAILYFLTWFIVLMYMAVDLQQSVNTVAPACTVNCWHSPPMEWKNTGPGTLVTQVNGTLHRQHVYDLTELTNGAETKLPVYWYADGTHAQHTLSGWFWFAPDGL